jgi:hypothetical protein
MSPGAIEEGAATARSFMDIMKEQPLSLALVVMNVALIVLIWWITNKQTDLRSHDLELYFQNQKETAAILARCVVPKSPQ